MSNSHRLALSNRVMEGVRAAVGTPERCAMLMYRDAPNVGDAAIWLAQLRVLRALGVDVTYAEAGRFFHGPTFERQVPDGPILISGGGSLGTTWARSHEFKERIIRAYPERRIVILPQSANFSTQESCERFLEVASTHPDLAILARDQRTFEMLRPLGAGVRLVPDMAFALEHARLGDRGIPSAARGRVLWLLRQDSETAGRTMEDVPGTRADWTDAPSVRVLLESDKLLARTRVRQLRRTRFAQWKAERRVDDGLALLSEHEIVVTDRLHGAVLSFLLGRRCIVLDNSWGKVHRFCRTWFDDTESVVLVSDMPEARRALDRVGRFG